MAWGVADSYDESSEINLEVARAGSRDFVLLEILADDGSGASVYLDSESARDLARRLVDYSTNIE